MTVGQLETLSMWTQIAAIGVAAIWGAASKRTSILTIAIICGVGLMDIVAYLLVGGGGPGFIPGLILFPLYCAIAAGIPRAIRKGVSFRW